ncbi:MAG TPA: alpha/beta hydrolase [Thermoanaerobaculia bacterium]
MDLSLALILLAASQGIVRSDIAYVDGGGHGQQLDLTIPATKSFPTIVFVHGGSLVEGDRRETPYNAVCAPFAQSGIGCAMISYRLFPEVRWPSPADDTAAAFAWIRKNIHASGGDPNRVYLGGHSSGCLLASLVGTDEKYLAKHDLTIGDIAGVIAIGCRVNDVIDARGRTKEEIARHFARDPYDAGFGSLDALNDAVPARHIGDAMPPFLIMMAESERFQPPILEDAEVFRLFAQKRGRSVRIRAVAKRKHMTLIEKMAMGGDDPAFQEIVDFIQSSESIRK